MCKDSVFSDDLPSFYLKLIKFKCDTISSMENIKETIVITGASGFIGSNLIRLLSEKYNIYALARRTQKEVRLKYRKNIHWILIDITDGNKLKQVFNKISEKQRIDFIIHLAAYYDFGDQVYNDIYQKTNIDATQYLLEIAKELDIKHFIFSSSLVASKFPDTNDLITENSELNAVYPYAKTKIIGEKLVKDYSKYYKCTIIRFAAVFSDCCEYEPLYNFLKTWCSKSWKARLIAGYGLMAIPYIHINCIVDLLYKTIKKTDKLNQLNIFLASSDEPTQLIDIFSESTKLFFGTKSNPLYVPKILGKMWILIRDWLGRIFKKRPFERYWMTEYLDRSFPTDCSYTRNTLDWYPKKRHLLLRRMPFLIENMQSMPRDWHHKNLSRLKRFKSERPSLLLSEEMQHNHDLIVEKIIGEISDPSNSNKLKYYQNLNEDQLRWNIEVFYNNLLMSIRHGDRSIMISFGHDFAKRHINDNVSVSELCSSLKITKEIILKNLYSNDRLAKIKLLINDNISLGIRLAVDEIKDTYLTHSPLK